VNCAKSVTDELVWDFRIDRLRGNGFKRPLSLAPNVRWMLEFLIDPCTVNYLQQVKFKN
jgi:hypothetical protein